MDCKIFAMAAHCYEVAKDSVRVTVANAFASAHNVKQNRGARLTTDQLVQRFKVPCCLILSMQPCKHSTVLSTHVNADVLLLDSIVQATCVFWHVRCAFSLKPAFCMPRSLVIACTCLLSAGWS